MGSIYINMGPEAKNSVAGSGWLAVADSQVWVRGLTSPDTTSVEERYEKFSLNKEDCRRKYWPLGKESSSWVVCPAQMHRQQTPECGKDYF